MSVCYCAALPSLTTASRVVILQHPRERDMPIGTGRMARLCLPDATLLVGCAWEHDPTLAAALADPARPPILLWPGLGARDIFSDPPAGPVTVIVVDGTWSQARTVIRDNPRLRALPRFGFVAPEPSAYAIRPEPDAAYVSTVEALAHVLGALERDPPRFRAMIDPLRAMVAAHLAERERSPSPRYRTRPPRALRDKLPAAIATRFEDLVCVVAEANAWPYADGTGLADELVHWVAHRPGTDESFDLVASPRHPLSPTTPHHTGLPADRILAGCPPGELVARYAAFARPTDILCAWGSYSLELFVAAGGALTAEHLDLRVAAQRLTQTKVGSLETYAATIMPVPPPPVAAGRGGARAALLAAIVRAWRAL